MGRRRRYHALWNGSAPQVWGTVTDAHWRSSKAGASALARSWLPWKRQGPVRRTRVRRSAGAGGTDGEAAGVEAGDRRQDGASASAAASASGQATRAAGPRQATFSGRSRLGAIAQPAQRQLDVDDQGFGRVLELVQAAVELGVVGLVGLVRLGQVLEARCPFHEALQAGLTVGVHVRGLGLAEVQAAQERADLAPAVLGPLHHALEVALGGRTDGEQGLDGALLEPLTEALGEARQLAAIAFRVGRALLRDDLA